MGAQPHPGVRYQCAGAVMQPLRDVLAQTLHGFCVQFKRVVVFAMIRQYSLVSFLQEYELELGIRRCAL